MMQAAFALLLVFATSVASGVTLTPVQALSQLRRSGILADAEIKGDLDISGLRPTAGVDGFYLENVTLRGSLIVKRHGPAVGMSIRGGTINIIDAVNTRWPAPLELTNLTVRQAVLLEQSIFQESVVWHNVTVSGPVNFSQTRFDAKAEFTQCLFNPPRYNSSPRFNEADFRGSVRFDRTVSAYDISFDGSRFGADTSFVGLKVAGTAHWRNTFFGGDAEFRLVKIGKAIFGDELHLSAFQKMADFRHAHFGDLVLDYIDIRGDLLMSGASIEQQFSLRQSALRGQESDLRGLRVGGALDLGGTFFERLRLHWAQLGPAIVLAKPAHETWVSLEESLRAQGRAREALTVSALRARREFEDSMGAAEPIDKLVLWTEELLWGRLTGYGTRLGQALLTLPMVLLFVAIPVLTSRVEFSEKGALAKVRVILHAAFGHPKCDIEPIAVAPRWWGAWRWIARGLGLSAVTLVTLTLTRVSPVLQGVGRALLG